jgi:hypothetical protein
VPYPTKLSVDGEYDLGIQSRGANGHRYSSQSLTLFAPLVMHPEIDPHWLLWRTQRVFNSPPLEV